MDVCVFKEVALADALLELGRGYEVVVDVVGLPGPGVARRA